MLLVRLVSPLSAVGLVGTLILDRASGVLIRCRKLVQCLTFLLVILCLDPLAELMFYMPIV